MLGGTSAVLLARGNVFHSFRTWQPQVRRCMEVVGRFHYHVIGGATGSGKGKLLDCLRDQGGQVPSLLAFVAFPCT